MQKILVIFGLVMFIDKLFKKWNVWTWIENIGMTSRFKFIYNMTKCDFCLKFHLSVIVTIIYGCFSDFEWSILIVPFVVGGLIAICIDHGL